MTTMINTTACQLAARYVLRAAIFVRECKAIGCH